MLIIVIMHISYHGQHIKANLTIIQSINYSATKII